MIRVSTNMPNDNLQYRMRLHDFAVNELSDSASSGSRINNLRDDPIAASQSTRFQSYHTRLERFSRNIEQAKGRHALAEGYMAETVNALHRIRELSLQGAHGTYTSQDLRNMGNEVNELLEELVALGNARSADGTMLFSGTRADALPFLSLEGRVPGLKGAMITEVLYRGNIDRNQTEISEGVFASTDFPGNTLFWAENQQLYSQVNGVDFRVLQDTTFRIDGKEISLTVGDNLQTIVSKINASDIAVKASVDPVTNSLILKTTIPHQLWLEEPEGSTVLRDLGILQAEGGRPPDNLHDASLLSGGSLFDTVIRVRDFMLSGDQESLGGRGLHGIDQSLDSVTVSLAELGSRDERLALTSRRLDHESPEVEKMNAQRIDADMAEVITELKMLEFIQRASYQMASRILQPTLMDFLR